MEELNEVSSTSVIVGRIPRRTLESESEMKLVKTRIQFNFQLDVIQFWKHIESIVKLEKVDQWEIESFL